MVLRGLPFLLAVLQKQTYQYLSGGTASWGIAHCWCGLHPSLTTFSNLTVRSLEFHTAHKWCIAIKVFMVLTALLIFEAARDRLLSKEPAIVNHCDWFEMYWCFIPTVCSVILTT